MSSSVCQSVLKCNIGHHDAAVGTINNTETEILLQSIFKF